MTKKLLDYKLQNAFFGNIPRGEWINHLPVKSGSKNMIILINCMLVVFLVINEMVKTNSVL